MLEIGKDFPDDPLSDDALVKAMRKRLLEEISAKNSAASVINNVYGGGHDAGGMMGALGGASPSSAGDDPYSYFVDIAKHDITDPETGKARGWEKSVHRYKRKKDEPERKKKVK